MCRFLPLWALISKQKPVFLYRQHETNKRREYGARLREVEHGGFTPLVFTTTGGVAPEAAIFMKHWASCLAEKRDENYLTTIGWLRCAISFCLLRSSLCCLRAPPSPAANIPSLDNVSDAVASSHLHCSTKPITIIFDNGGLRPIACFV